jgi:hypothetical protein
VENNVHLEEKIIAAHVAIHFTNLSVISAKKATPNFGNRGENAGNTP